MISTDRLKDIGNVPVFPCTVGFRNYVPTGTGVRDTVLVLGGDGTGTPWNGVGPETLTKLFIKSTALDGSDYSKLVLKSQLGTSYFELSEQVVGVTKGVFINLGDLATTGDASVQLREISYNDGADGYAAWVLASEPVSTDSGGVGLGLIQTSFSTLSNTVSVLRCDANGVTTGDPFDVYIYAGQGDFDPSTMVINGASLTPTNCTIEAGKIISYGTSGTDKYMIGDIAQVISDMRIDATTGQLEVKAYWKFGIAVSSLSTWLKVDDTVESQEISCTAPGS